MKEEIVNEMKNDEQKLWTDLNEIYCKYSDIRESDKRIDRFCYKIYEAQENLEEWLKSVENE